MKFFTAVAVAVIGFQGFAANGARLVSETVFVVVAATTNCRETHEILTL